MCVCSLSPAVIEDQGKILGTRKRDTKTSRIQEYAGIGSYTRVLCGFQMANLENFIRVIVLNSSLRSKMYVQSVQRYSVNSCISPG